MKHTTIIILIVLISITMSMCSSGGGYATGQVEIQKQPGSGYQRVNQDNHGPSGSSNAARSGNTPPGPSSYGGGGNSGGGFATGQVEVQKQPGSGYQRVNQDNRQSSGGFGGFGNTPSGSAGGYGAAPAGYRSGGNSGSGFATGEITVQKHDGSYKKIN